MCQVQHDVKFFKVNIFGKMVGGCWGREAKIIWDGQN